jgi:hypothetical protein
LDAGRKFFDALAASSQEADENCPWKIHTTKGDINTVRPSAKAQPAKLVCAVNVFNEMYGDISRGGEESLKRGAEKSARLLATHASAEAYVLVVEPGFPRCGEFISLLREAFMKRGRLPLAPCTHHDDCPFNQKRWCHFAFETEDAPHALHRLSRAAGLPKERAVLSFLFTGPNHVKQSKHALTPTPLTLTPTPLTLTPTPLIQTKLTPTVLISQMRVISDAFFLPPRRLGRYCCSPQGMVLLAGENNVIEKAASGSLVNALITDERDPKSGASMAELPHTKAQRHKGRRNEKREMRNEK